MFNQQYFHFTFSTNFYTFLFCANEKLTYLSFFIYHKLTVASFLFSIPILDFPSCVIGDQPELTAESLEIGDSQLYSWRNVFSCINLLRILNKLTKWKHSRIMVGRIILAASSFLYFLTFKNLLCFKCNKI